MHYTLSLYPHIRAFERGIVQSSTFYFIMTFFNWVRNVGRGLQTFFKGTFSVKWPPGNVDAYDAHFGLKQITRGEFIPGLSTVRSLASVAVSSKLLDNLELFQDHSFPYITKQIIEFIAVFWCKIKKSMVIWVRKIIWSACLSFPKV